ncbi:AraC family transcriptional regulator [Bacillus sp. JCM 19041]|uniref:AraC family transcriptional regulator n=1 Tax=Bacillus sp. JCM 19041 TaxID=1460637 RepID=UPI0006D1221B
MQRLTCSIRKQAIYVDYRKRCSPPYGMSHYHLHSDVELHWLAEGERMFFCNGQAIPLKQHSLLILSPHLIHKMEPASRPVHARYVVNAHLSSLPDEWRELTKPLFAKEFSLLEIPVHQQQQIHSLFNQLLIEYKRPITQESLLYQQVLLCQLLLEAQRQFHSLKEVQTKSSAVFSGPFEIVAHLIEYIEHHFDEALDLNTLASVVHLSPAYTSRIFKQATGQGLTEHLQEVRISQACKRLVKTNEPIFQLARRVGFQSSAHFHRVFKRILDLSPTQYRNKQQRKNGNITKQ